MTVVLIAAALVVTAAIAGLAYAVHRLVGLVDRIDERANAERHVLAGRIQNPNIFPTAPLTGTSAPEAPETPPDGFEVAGRDLTGLSDESLAKFVGWKPEDD